MKSKRLLLVGILLILAGLVGLGITRADMMEIYSTEAITSAPVLAEAIGHTLAPAAVGTLLALAGLIMVLLGWWRGRTRKQTASNLKFAKTHL